MDLKLLSETRRACFRLCLISVAVVMLLVLVQTITGKLVGEAGEAWLWVALVALPALLMVWVSILLNKYPAKVVHPAAYSALVWGSAAYYGLILLTILSEPFATQAERSVMSYFQQSLLWLLPLEAVLLAGYALAFFRKESFFRPNEQIILDFAAKKAVDAQIKGKVWLQQSLELIAANDMPGVFAKMKERFGTTNSSDLNAAVLLENQYNELVRSRDLNMVEPATAQTSLNRIVMGVINLAERL
jgi:hypothetical protein